MSPEILGIQKTNKKGTEYFVGVDTTNGEMLFDSNPLRGFTSSDINSVELLRKVLSANDKRNTYTLYQVKVSQVG